MAMRKLTRQEKFVPIVFDGASAAEILAHHPKARLKLIRARLGHGLSRPQLGKRLGIPRGTIYRVEMGISNPGLERMHLWATELEATLDIFSPPPKRAVEPVAAE